MEEKQEIKLNEQQQDGFDRIIDFLADKTKTSFTLMGYGGTGKHQPFSSTIYTPEGKTTMGNIVEGSMVLNRKGISTKVLKVFPKENMKTYVITFEDGSTVECCEEHLWKVQTNKQRQTGNFSVITIKEMLDKGLNISNSLGYRYSVDLCEPVEHTKKELPIDSYTLGYMIGNGHLSDTNQVTITIGEKDYEDISNNLIFTMPVRHTVRPDYAPTICKIGVTVGIRELLKSINLLNTSSNDKFIPDIYKYSCIEDRLSILQGLMDSDGTIGVYGKKKKVRFSSNSLLLCQDVVEIVQSLGGIGIISKSDRTNDNKGVEYTVSIRTKQNCFRLKRKAELFDSVNWHFLFRKKIVKADYIGLKDGQCIYIDDEEHLYLTDSYTVTHNTTLIKFIVEYIRSNKYTNIILCSPTHQANKIIKNSLGFSQEVKTIASLFNNRYNIVKRKFEFQLAKDDALPAYSTLIIDECSMINTETFEVIITTCAERDVKVIFMGDKMQIPPIGSKYISPTFTETDDKFLLTKLMRQNHTNPIVELYSQIRDNPLNSVPFKTLMNEETGEGFGIVKHRDTIKMLINKRFNSEEFKIDKKFCRILCYTNAKVEEYNRMVRDIIFEDSRYEYQINDLLKGYDQVSLNNKIQNGQDYLVVSSSDIVKPVFLVDVTGIKLDTPFNKYSRKAVKVEVNVKEVILIEINDNTDVFDKENERIVIYIPELTPINNVFFNMLSSLSNIQGKIKDYKLKTELYKELTGIFKSIQLDDTIFLHDNKFVSLKLLKKSNPEMFTTDDFGYCEYDDLLNKHKALLLKKNIDYGYASSIHKIQGSTLKNAIVDIKDVYNPITAKTIYEGDEPFTTERNTLLYVALSRSKLMTYGYI